MRKPKKGNKYLADREAKPLAFALKQIMDKQTYTDDDQFTENRFSVHVLNAHRGSTNSPPTEEKKQENEQEEEKTNEKEKKRLCASLENARAKGKVKNTIK